MLCVLGSTYLETLRVQIHANVRIRRIYFSDRLYSEDELPREYKLYLPMGEGPRGRKAAKGKEAAKGAEPAVKDEATSMAEAKPEEEKIPSGAPPTPTAEGPEKRKWFLLSRKEITRLE